VKKYAAGDPPFLKVLIANRGEIAVRVATTCQALGVVAAAVYAPGDGDALHVRVADEAYALGGDYLDLEKVIEVALEARADALHPGYGFLSENPALPEACRAAGIVFIGPSPEAMRALGDKRRAKILARRAGVPTVPGYDGEDQDDAVLEEQARLVGTPLLIKATAGGGGRGMREVHDLADFAEALRSARREARNAFGDETVLLEKLVSRPRHIEIQLMGDAHGSVIHLGERECSIQRRHQKIVEEAPSPAVSPALRAEMGAAAVRLAREAAYTNAGTAEFMLDADGRYYFLEMNARLQVEHPVTEIVTGLDLVALQLHLAAGRPLPLTQEDVTLRGHAVECRVYAEDPAAGFLPSIGPLRVYAEPHGPGVRVDSGVSAGDEVTTSYDPLLAKLITSGETRAEAVQRGLRALRRFAVLGVTTNIAFLSALLDHPSFQEGDLSTGFVAEHLSNATPTAPTASTPHDVLLLAALWGATAALTASGQRDPWRGASGWSGGAGLSLRYATGGREDTVVLTRAGSGGWSATVGDTLYEATSAWRDHGAADAGGLTVTLETGRVLHGYVASAAPAVLVSLAGVTYTLRPLGPPDLDALGGLAQGGGQGGESALTAPMPGTIVRILVREGDRVKARQRLAVLEAMKMEHDVTAPYDGVVRAVAHREGDLVAAGDRLIELEATSEGTSP